MKLTVEEREKQVDIYELTFDALGIVSPKEFQTYHNRISKLAGTTSMCAPTYVKKLYELMLAGDTPRIAAGKIVGKPMWMFVSII